MAVRVVVTGAARGYGEVVSRHLAEAEGGLDALVNNAGVGGPLGLAWDVPEQDWWQCVEVNLRGTHHATSAAVPHLVGARGVVVNVVSHAGTARWPFGSAYAVSKAAVIKYGENLAGELRREGVTVLNYHPGIMELGLTAGLFDSEPEPGTPPWRVAEWFRSEIAAGHHMDPDLSAARLVELVLHPLPHLSGGYLTAYQDPVEVRALERPPLLGVAPQ